MKTCSTLPAFYVGEYKTKFGKTEKMSSNVKMTEEEFKKAMKGKTDFKAELWILTNDEFLRRKFGD